MRRVVALWSLFAVACATPPPAALEPFLAAGRFVPPGMQSITCERDMAILTLDVRAPIVVMAGRDFEPPGDFDCGPSCTIWVADHGADAEAARRCSVSDRRIESVRIAERDGWHVLPEGLWCTTVDDRFVLWATRPDVLAAGLERNGDLTASLAPFGDLGWMPADAKRAMFLSPRPGWRHWSWEPPSQHTVIVELAAPSRLVLCARGAPDPLLSGWLGAWCSQVGEPVATEHGWSLRTGMMREVDELTFELSWLTLFGFVIFI